MPTGRSVQIELVEIGSTLKTPDFSGAFDSLGFLAGSGAYFDSNFLEGIAAASIGGRQVNPLSLKLEFFYKRARNPMSRKIVKPLESKPQRRRSGRQNSSLRFQQLEQRKLLAGLIFEMFETGCSPAASADPEVSLVSEAGEDTIGNESSADFESFIGCQGPADFGPGDEGGNFGQEDDLNDPMPRVGDDFNPGDFGEPDNTGPWDGELAGDVENIRSIAQYKAPDDVVGIDATLEEGTDYPGFPEPPICPMPGDSDELTTRTRDVDDSSEADYLNGYETVDGEESTSTDELARCEDYPLPVEPELNDSGEENFSDVTDSPMPKVDDDFNSGEFGEPGDTDTWNGELAGEVENIDARFDGSEAEGEFLSLTPGLVWANSVRSDDGSSFGWDMEIANEAQSSDWAVSLAPAMQAADEEGPRASDEDQLVAVIELADEGAELTAGASEESIASRDYSLLDDAFSDESFLTLAQFLSDNDE